MHEIAAEIPLIGWLATAAGAACTPVADSASAPPTRTHAVPTLAASRPAPLSCMSVMVVGTLERTRVSGALAGMMRLMINLEGNVAGAE